MKKVLFVLAFVAVYGVSMAMTSSSVVVADDAQVTIVAAMDDIVTAPAIEKEEAKKAEKSKTTAKAKGDAKAEGCAGTKSEAKAKGCSGEKTAEAKKDCASACGGEKK